MIKELKSPTIVEFTGNLGSHLQLSSMKRGFYVGRYLFVKQRYQWQLGRQRIFIAFIRTRKMKAARDRAGNLLNRLKNTEKSSVRKSGTI